ncbi:MAG: Ig-like domain-containing protein, partial [Pseudomonadota bacterium]
MQPSLTSRTPARWLTSKIGCRGQRRARLSIPTILIFGAFIISSCGGGGGGGGTPTTPGTPETPASQTTSNAIKGPLLNTLITITDDEGNIVDSFTANTGGGFNLDLPASAEYPLIITTEGGTDSISGVDVSSLDLTLKSVVFSPTQTHVNINPLSTLAVEVLLASNEQGQSGLLGIISSLAIYGYGLPSGFNPVNSLQTVNNAADALMAYETFFEAVRRTSIIRNITANEVIEALAADLVDGLVDGQGTASVNAQTSATFNSISAQVLMEGLAGELILYRDTPQEMMLSAANVNDAIGVIVGEMGNETTAVLSHTAANIAQATNFLIAARAGTTDGDDIVLLSDAITSISSVTPQESPSAEQLETVRVALSQVDSVIAEVAENLDADEVMSSNQAAGDAFGQDDIDETPFANNDEVSTSLQTPISFNVLTNDTGIGDLPLTVTVSNPPEGMSSVEQNIVTYTPGSNTVGEVSFTYTVRDVDGDESTATITVFVDDQPVALDDVATTQESVAVEIDVLANDLGLGNGVTVEIADTPDNGAAAVSNSSITYAPNAGFIGTDTLTYLIRDADGQESTAEVTIQVAANIIPVAVDDDVTTNVNTPIGIDVLANDLGIVGQSLTISATGAMLGTTSVDGLDVIYTPMPTLGGTDTFEYTIVDGNDNSSSATVTVYIDDMPVANNDEAATSQGATTIIDVLDNDAGLANPPITLQLSQTPQEGTAVVSGSTIEYTPSPQFFGEEFFVYRIEDSDGD